MSSMSLLNSNNRLIRFLAATHKKLKSIVFKKVTTGLMQLYVRTKQIPAVGAQAVG
jgi:hypothetical protein